MNMTKMLNRLLGEDISLQVNCTPELPMIYADPGMMEQILLNLAVNSRDAMPKGGSLLVNTSFVTVDEEYQMVVPDSHPGEFVCLTVKDTGTGIPLDVLPHIFEPFFTTKDVGKGTGLGLATVYGIVQQHKGWIKPWSVPNKETVFEIFLPCLKEHHKPVETITVAAPPKIEGGKETVLVVEDEPPLLMLVRAILERYGYKVLEAVSGREAFPVWEENKDKIDLLVTDMVMPGGVTGRELAVKLLESKPSLKVIYCSGYSLDVVGNDMMLHEGLNFLQKPYHPGKLARTVRDCLDAKN
jgi:CheY-like chemotaxis protein